MHEHKPRKGVEPFSSLHESDEITKYSTSAFEDPFQSLNPLRMVKKTLGQILSFSRSGPPRRKFAYLVFPINYNLDGVHES